MTLNLSRRQVLSFMGLAAVSVVPFGCTGGEPTVADPTKDKVPPPPAPIKAGDKGAARPKGGGSPPGSPLEYSK